MAAMKKETNRAAKESTTAAAICLSNRYIGDQYRRSSIGAIHSLYFSPGRDAAGWSRTGQRWKTLQFTTASNNYPAYPEPTSPKVGCMGQIKCHQQHHDAHAFPKPLKPGSSTDGMRNTLTKIKKAFSGKWARRKDGENYEFVAQDGTGKENIGHSVSLEIDPPLQIIRDVVIQGCEGSSLWKRRSAGVSLKKLQIEKGGVALTAGTPLTV